jgi:hypothetical protein
VQDAVRQAAQPVMVMAMAALPSRVHADGIASTVHVWYRGGWLGFIGEQRGCGFSSGAGLYR